MDKTPSETTFFLFVHDISNIHKTSRPQVKLFGGRVSKRLIHFPRTVKKITSSHLGAVRRRYDKQGDLNFFHGICPRACRFRKRNRKQSVYSFQPNNGRFNLAAFGLLKRPLSLG